ncbi:MAG: hypothetical protein WDZ28_03385 [Simkaniaceae bacterium]
MSVNNQSNISSHNVTEIDMFKNNPENEYLYKNGIPLTIKNVISRYADKTPIYKNGIPLTIEDGSSRYYIAKTPAKEITIAETPAKEIPIDGTTYELKEVTTNFKKVLIGVTLLSAGLFLASLTAGILLTHFFTLAIASPFLFLALILILFTIPMALSAAS